MDDRQTITVSQMAEQLGICYRVALKMLKNNEIPCYFKCGNKYIIPKSAFSHFLESAGCQPANKTGQGR